MKRPGPGAAQISMRRLGRARASSSGPSEAYESYRTPSPMPERPGPANPAVTAPGRAGRDSKSEPRRRLFPRVHDRAGARAVAGRRASDPLLGELGPTARSVSTRPDPADRAGGWGGRRSLSCPSAMCAVWRGHNLLVNRKGRHEIYCERRARTDIRPGLSDREASPGERRS